MNDKKINKLIKESLTDDMKNVFPECKSSREHRWIWASIGLLFLGQLFSFVYIHNFHDSLLSKRSAELVVNANFDDEDNLPSLAESPSLDDTTWTDKLLPVHERRKRSSDPKPNRKRSPKKQNGRRPRSDKQMTTPAGTLTTFQPITMAPGALNQVNVEFVNPKFREEHLSSSSSNPDNPWVWLNAYSRIPVNAIQDFCSATKDYCPPGPVGPLGPSGPVGMQGPKGERGERGLAGEVGPRGFAGPVGPPGAKGPKGDLGKTGLPGLNGRDGVPGEPGLDGVPGRSGTPGMDGIPGIDGLPGQSGADGADGSPGLTGPAGEPGPLGPQGLTGPRGKPGRSGIPGIPGIPGVNTWVVNSTDSRRIVLVPPSILGGEIMANSSRTTIIKEGDNLRLRCGTAGNPRPEVSWMRADGLLTPIGSWQTSDVLGPTFNITKINRLHTGVYICVADNGIPPPAYRTFNVEVHFPPFIRVGNPSIGVSNGSSVVLECDVEAFPEPVCYWERTDGRSIDSEHKAFLRDQGKYKVYMTLNLTVTNPDTDYGRYQCVCKNELGTTRGEVNVFEVDPRFSQTTGGVDVKTWGPSPPDMIDLEDMCPPPPDCPRCPALPAEKCRGEGGLGMFDVLGRIDIRPLGNETYAGFANRSQDCVLSAIGKPVFHRFTDAPYGNWMRDSLPRTTIDVEKYWATKYNESYTLYEYSNKTTFKKDIPLRNYTLPFALKGYLHVIYNGSLYYHQAEESRVIRYELAAERQTLVNLPNATITNNVFLYSQSQSYLDFSVDETGLWVIYGLQPTNNTAVAKLNPYSLELEYVWNISVNNQRAGEMFVACGVLYAVDSVNERSTKIRFALDLYRNKLLEVDLAFTNPFRKTSMLGYNARTKELYSWDRGNQLTYPVKSVDIGYNTPENDIPNDRIDINGPEAFIQEDDFQNGESLIEIT